MRIIFYKRMHARKCQQAPHFRFPEKKNSNTKNPFFMADNNRNWGSYRSSDQDWDNDYNRSEYEDDRGSFRGRYEGGHGNDWGRSRQDYGQGSTYGESRYDRERSNDSRDRDSDYNRNYGSGSYGSYGRDYSNYGSGRYRGSQRAGIGGGFGFGESGDFRSRYDRERQSYSPGGYQNYGGGSGYGGNQWTGGYGGSSYGRNMGSGYGSGYGSSDYSSGGYGGGLGESYGSNYGSSDRYGYSDRYGSSYDRDRSYGGNWDSRRESDRGRRQDDRGWWDRTTDEISSWFGDEEAERRRRMDRMYRGKGPKNYQRSDDRIREDINDRLSDDWFVDASDVEVTVNSGEVTLSGTVDERTSKRRAEDIAESVSGVKHVENRLRVSSNLYSGSQSERTATGTATLGSSTGTTGVGATTTTSRSRTTVNENK